MRRIFYLSVFFIVSVVNLEALSQPSDAVYGTYIGSGGDNALVGGDHKVTNAIGAANSSTNVKPNSNSTTLYVKSTTGVSTAYLQLGLATSSDPVIPGGTTVYIKTTTSALGLLNLIGGAAIKVEPYLNTTATGSAIALNPAGIKTYYTADGNIYMAVTPASAFKSIKISLVSAAVAGLGTIDVFYAFYGRNALNNTNPFPFNIADCGLPNVSEVNTSGAVTLSSFVNPSYAIDNSISTATAFTTTLALLGKMTQTYYFNGPSNLGDAVRIMFSKGTAAALGNVDIASNLTIQAFNGNTEVGTATPFSSLLTLNLLSSDLLGGAGGTVITAYLTPKNGNSPAVFDRVVVSFTLATNLSLDGLTGLNGNGLNVYDVRRVPSAPASSDATACTNIGTAALNALTSQANINGVLTAFTYKWYTALTGGSAVATGSTYSVNNLSSAGQRSYYVDTQKTNCVTANFTNGDPSSRIKVNISVVNPPVSPPVALAP
ncbi:hypothetical protein SAMN04487995_5042 [Dyadobacter koreensis]|uniref:Ig-like domain-containing protein n=1 Tax=Dyadobacter koreensis TaxID=408657 RepID=A0A1H6Z9G5_9BACT|nr:hypothetical protein [Dyadobacter koreensis]SEJ50121.1 hypothetical protein SAMN04487995_5042 [Dyadobacter koreensis]